MAVDKSLQDLAKEVDDFLVEAGAQISAAERDFNEALQGLSSVSLVVSSKDAFDEIYSQIIERANHLLDDLAEQEDCENLDDTLTKVDGLMASCQRPKHRVRSAYEKYKSKNIEVASALRAHSRPSRNGRNSKTSHSSSKVSSVPHAEMQKIDAEQRMREAVLRQQAAKQEADLQAALEINRAQADLQKAKLLASRSSRGSSHRSTTSPKGEGSAGLSILRPYRSRGHDVSDVNAFVSQAQSSVVTTQGQDLYATRPQSSQGQNIYVSPSRPSVMTTPGQNDYPSQAHQSEITMLGQSSTASDASFATCAPGLDGPAADLNLSIMPPALGSSQVTRSVPAVTFFDGPAVGNVPGVAPLVLTSYTNKLPSNVIPPMVTTTFTSANGSPSPKYPYPTNVLPRSRVDNSQQSPPCFQPSFPSPDPGLQALRGVVGTMKRNVDLQSIRIDNFGGDPRDYMRFRTEFKNIFEPPLGDDLALVYSAADKLNALYKFCAGEARKTIEHCRMGKIDEEAYQSAWTVLYENYGRPLYIVGAFIEDLTAEATVDTSDLLSLARISDRLQSASRVLSQCDALSHVEAPKVLYSIYERFPKSFMKDFISRHKPALKKGEEPSFSQFVSFVKDEVSVAKSPLVKFVNGLPSRVSRVAPAPRKMAVKAYSTVTEPSDRGTEEAAAEVKAPECTYCGGAHSLPKCLDFMKLPSDKRKDFVRSKHFCFNCLKSSTHDNRKCSSPYRCRLCSKAHHTILHEAFLPSRSTYATPGRESATTSTAAPSKPITAGINSLSTSDPGIRTHLRVVPVKIMHPSSHKIIITHAFLDNGSTRSLCTSRLMRKLGIEGTPETCHITTVLVESMCNCQSLPLSVQGLDEERVVYIDNVLCCDGIFPSVEYSIPTLQSIGQYSHLRDIPLPTIDCQDVDILIAQDVTAKYPSMGFSKGTDDLPSAEYTVFGWALMGKDKTLTSRDGTTVATESIHCTDIHTIGSSLEIVPDNLSNHCSAGDGNLCSGCASEFPDLNSDPYQTHPSIDDERAQSIMESTVCKVDGRFQVGLPWKEENVSFPNNRAMALKALEYLRRKFERDPELFSKYTDKIDEYLSNGYACAIPPELAVYTKRTFYLVHFNTCQKKMRVVFDASRAYLGTSLNRQLLTGPDVNSSQIGVLCRFREGSVAFACDIKQMFHRIRTYPQDSDSLRFLWWKDSNLANPIVDHQMNVHLFGASSSPAVAQFCLRQVAERNETGADSDTIECIRRNMYVDDCLRSEDTVEGATKIIRQLCPLLESCGFHLTKFVSNSVEVLADIPESDRASNVVDLDLENSDAEHALGVIWNVSNDRLEVRTQIQSRELTKRGLASMTAQVYDPFGFLAPFLLPAKLLLQELSRLELPWNGSVEEPYRSRFIKWAETLPNLSSVSFPRCYKPTGFVPVNIQLHNFADASKLGYSACSYLRFMNAEGDIHVSFVRGLARVVPKNSPTIPRLELTAAVAAVKLARAILKDLAYNVDSVYYWTDSTSVIQCITTTAVRFHTFVHQRLLKIHALSRVEQWWYVDSARNPADIGSRGLMPNRWNKARAWFDGPEFLLCGVEAWPDSPIGKLNTDQPDLKREIVSFVDCGPCATTMNDFLHRFSSFTKLVRATAWLIRLRTILLKRSKKGCLGDPTLSSLSGPLTVIELDQATEEVVRLAQGESYPSVINYLYKHTDAAPVPRAGRRHPVAPLSKALAKLAPFIRNGVMRVGGRLSRSQLPYYAKCPLILPPSHHLTRLVIEHYHKSDAHLGTKHVLSRIRERFWIVKGQFAVRKILSKCLYCQRMSAPLGSQYMADPPESRVVPGRNAFHHTMADYFGPLKVKRGRTELKRWGCIFTCLNTRAVHLEVVDSLESSAFLMAFHKFVDLRGSPAPLYSDNGTTFVGAHKDLGTAIKSLNTDSVSSSLSNRGIQWHFSPPLAPHHNGAVERIIKDVKRVLYAMNENAPFKDNTLSAIFTGAARILNDRPLTPMSDDPGDLECLTPNAILLGRLDPSLPTHTFCKADEYSQNGEYERDVRKLCPLELS